MKTLPVELKFVSSHTTPPEYKNPGDAGADLIADIRVPIDLAPGEMRIISTGVAISINNPNYVCLLFSRSGMGCVQVNLSNGVGVLDSSYQGEIKLMVQNLGQQHFEILPGMRLGQMVIVPVIHADFKVVSEFSSATERGANGFGSTGYASNH